MSVNPLTFKELKERMKMCGAEFSCPYTTTPGYFIGSDKAKAAFPHATGPIYYLSNRPDSELIPSRMTGKILKHMGIAHDAFWAIEVHRSNEAQSGK